MSEKDEVIKDSRETVVLEAELQSNEVLLHKLLYDPDDDIQNSCSSSGISLSSFQSKESTLFVFIFGQWFSFRRQCLGPRWTAHFLLVAAFGNFPNPPVHFLL